MNMLLFDAARLDPPRLLPLYKYSAQFAPVDPCGRRAGYQCVGSICLAGRWERPTHGADRPDFLVYANDHEPPLAVESKINNSIQANQLQRYEKHVDRGAWNGLVFLSHLGTPDDKRVARHAGESYRFLLWEDVLAFIVASSKLASIAVRLESEVARIASEAWISTHLERQAISGRLPHWWKLHRDRCGRLEYYLHGTSEFADVLGVTANQALQPTGFAGG